MKDFYSKVYSTAYANGYRAGKVDYTRGESLIHHLISSFPFESVLDVGCGFGYGVDLFARNEKKSVGIDVVPDVIQKAQSLGRNCVVGSALSIPFPDNSFDLVFSADTFEHLRPEDVPKALTECLRVARRSVVIKVDSKPARQVKYFTGLGLSNPHLTIHSLDWWIDQARVFSKDVEKIGKSALIMKKLPSQLPIRVFIGSDIHNVKADRALRYSILKNTNSPVEFTIMSRFNDQEIWKSWRKTSQWTTCFSCFRWAIPAACDYQGKAIYLDSDMIVLGDIKELFDSNASLGIATTRKRKSSVMVFDCSKFSGIPEFEIGHLKRNAGKTSSYYKHLEQKGMVNFITQDWNCLDGDGWVPGKTKLLHFTKLRTQPWHPAPHRFKYVPHPLAALESLWLEYYEESYEASLVPNSLHQEPTGYR